MSSRLDRVKNWEALAKESRFRIAEIALRRGVSPRQVERYFRTRFGESPHSRFNRIRLQETKRLLSLGMSVKEVAAALYFQDAAHFSHAFKKEFGVSPSQWSASSLK
jgi:AraC-like DNA-binding protein